MPVVIRKYVYTKQSPSTYLDHDHREREDIRFLAIFLTLQYLWRSQALGFEILIGERLSGILVRSDCSDRETHNSRATLGIHEHI